MTNAILESLLQKFSEGHSIPPLVLSDTDAVTVINRLKHANLFELRDLKTEYTDGVFFFENETGAIKIERTREIIELSSRRSSSGYDIFVIEGIDTLTLAAGNSLLKLFEEVPSNILILLTTASGRDALLETLASRVIFVSSNTHNTLPDPDILSKIDTYFDVGDQLPLLSFLATAKLEKTDYLGILMALKERVLSRDIKNPLTIEAIESGIITIASTNANARWVVDRVVLGM